MQNVRTRQEIEAFGARVNSPVFLATAIEGTGVVETLRGLLELCWSQLDAKYNFGERLGLSQKSFLTGLFEDWQQPTDELARLSW